MNWPIITTILLWVLWRQPSRDMTCDVCMRPCKMVAGQYSWRQKRKLILKMIFIQCTIKYTCKRRWFAKCNQYTTRDAEGGATSRQCSCYLYQEIFRYNFFFYFLFTRTKTRKSNSIVELKNVIDEPNPMDALINFYIPGCDEIKLVVCSYNVRPLVRLIWLDHPLGKIQQQH